jgi:hypothetical protein
MPSFVSFGALRVIASARRDFEQAVAYLSHDPRERALFARLENGPHHVTITTNARNADYYDPSTRTIHWDPHSALRTSDGGRQSPALGLGHEADHAAHDGPREWARANTPDRRYDTAEERRVITGSERHVAHTLGESTRTNHTGTCYRVNSPTTCAIDERHAKTLSS